MTDTIDVFIQNIHQKYGIPISGLESCLPVCKKKKKPNEIDDHSKCLGRKQDGKQCTRRKKEGCDFCGKHLNNQKYGRVDDNKSTLQTDMIRTVVKKIGTKEYLLDEDNNIYTLEPESPEFIGKLIGENIVSCL